MAVQNFRALNRGGPPNSQKTLEDLAARGIVPGGAGWSMGGGAGTTVGGGFNGGAGGAGGAGGLGGLLSGMMGGGGGAPTPAPAATNTAQIDPYLQRQAARVEKRLDNPEDSTGRAIDVATSKIRDANIGRKRAIQGMLAKRGVLSSSSIPELSEAAMSQQEGQDVNRAAADISLQRERDEDAFLLGSTSTLGAPGSAQRADRSLAQQQWESFEANRRAQEREGIDRFMGVLGIIDRLGV